MNDSAVPHLKFILEKSGSFLPSSAHDYFTVTIVLQHLENLAYSPDVAECLRYGGSSSKLFASGVSY